MVKASEVIGLQVTVREGGRDVGRIRDLVIDPAGREVIGIVLSESVFTGSRVAPWKAVQAFGPDSVIIDAASSVVKPSAAPEIKSVLDKKTKIRGLKLLTTKGKELGKIIDFAFDETAGAVDGYELSSRLFSDLIDGNPFLPTPQWIELGKDVAFVAPEAEPTIRSSAGGDKKASVTANAPKTADAPATEDAPADAGTGAT